MTKNLIVAAIIASIVVLTTSCGTEEPCLGSGTASFGFTGFDSATLEKVIVITYTTDRNKPVDSTMYLLSASPTPLRYNDTLRHLVIWPYDGSVAPLYSYEIRIPATGAKHVISNIVYGNNTYHRPFNERMEICYNNAVSYDLDGKKYETNFSQGGWGKDNLYIDIAR